MCLKLCSKVKSYKEKISGEWRVWESIDSSILFTFVYIWNFLPLKQFHVPSFRYGLGGTDLGLAQSLDNIYIRGHVVWAKSPTWICGAVLHNLSSQLQTQKGNNFLQSYLYGAGFFFLMIRLISVLSGGKNLI